MRSTLIGEEIALLRDAIRENDGINIANWSFARKVDLLIRAFYDEIGEITSIGLPDIIDLFLIKVLYVDRQSRDAGSLFYLSELLQRNLLAGELSLGPGRGMVPYLSTLTEEVEHPSGAFPNLFETYRKYGDNAMFISGVLPESIGKRRRSGGRLGGSAFVDRSYFIWVGRQYYQRAADEDAAEEVAMRGTLLTLAQWFEVYVDALNDVSGRYVLGIDRRVIADRMLDAFNRYRETNDKADLAMARRYGALMKIDANQFPGLGY
jgi:hypothetical protein